MRIVSSFLVPVTLGACSTGNATGSDGGSEHPIVIQSSDAPSAIDASSEDAGGLHTSLRLALLSPLGFGVDVCIKGSATSGYLGPLLNPQLPSAGDAGAHDARAKDAAGTRDATLPSDATSDARDDLSPDATGEASTDGARESAAIDANEDGEDGSRLDGSEDGKRAQVDGSLEDARGPGDASPDASLDGGQRVGGVLFGQVSGYLSLPLAGTMEIAIVRGGSTTCSDLSSIHRVTLDAGKLYTLAVVRASGPTDGGVPDSGPLGDATSDAHLEARAPELPLSVLVLTDEPQVSASFARARFFNGLLSSADAAAPSLDVAAVEGTASVPLALDVPSLEVARESPSGPAVDSLGYWEGAALVSTAPISLRVVPIARMDAGDGGPSGWIFTSTSSFDLQHAASNHSGFLVGNPGPQAGLVWCDDGASVEDGGSTLTSCTLFTQ